MIIYDGTYRLRSPNEDLFDSGRCAEPTWWVRVISFSGESPGIRFLKPWGVFATPSAPGDYRISCAQSLAETIFNDFGMTSQEVLWVEHFKKDPGHLHVAEFVSGTGKEPAAAGNVRWRSIRANELKVIRRFIPEAQFIEIPAAGPS